MSTQVGTLLSGRYRLDAQVGTGGMSTVFVAFDTVLERRVAIKLMHRDIAGQPDQLERFRREARAVAQLNHPHVVQVIDAGEDDGQPYIVLEYVEGETLKDRIRRGPLPVGEAIAYAIEIARALGAAHDCGIVHRDVKPQNVLLDEEGSAKVTDFGIARTLGQEGLTADGRVLGTTDYVSPEQALGHPVTGQSDLYSLGIVLFEMLTGDVPFHGDNQVAVAMRHVREDLPDVQQRRPEVSAALAAVVDRCTAKDLNRRYADDNELIAALEDALAIETARAGRATGEATAVLRTLPERQRRRLPLRLRTPLGAFIAVTVAAVVAVALAIVLAADRTQRGTGAEPATNGAAAERAGLEPVRLGQTSATAFDPLGTGGEHDDEADFAIDDDPSSTWSTETYRDGLTKDGVGLYVDAEPGLAAQAIELETPTPGFAATIYGATSGPPDGVGGWTRLARDENVTDGERIRLDTGSRRFRYYLVWITALPEDEPRVKIAQLRLLGRAQ